MRVKNKATKIGGVIVGHESDDILIVRYDGFTMDRRVNISDVKVVKDGRKKR